MLYPCRESKGLLPKLERRRKRVAAEIEKLRKQKDAGNKILAKILISASEEEKLKDTLFFFSAKGSVFYPLLLYIISLTFSAWAIVSSGNEQVVLALTAGIFLFSGLVLLRGTLLAVENAALRFEK
jgi:hypothetical protein